MVSIRRYESAILNSRGGTRAWSRMVARVVREEPLCRLRLEGCTTMSTTADHIRPRKTHPHLADKRWNLRGSCRSCNMRRGARPDRQMAPLRKRQRPAKALGFFGRK